MKQPYTISLVALSILLTAPSFALAGGLPYAGSSNYLQDSGVVLGTTTDIKAPLENRKPLDLTAGETTLVDPLGDVLDSVGGVSTLNASWGDIKSVSFGKDVEKNSWRMQIGVGSAIPTTPPVGTRILAQIDRDSLTENNDPKPGEKQQIDRQYAVTFTTSGWKTSFERYEGGSWIPTDTAASSSVEKDAVIIRIPFEELDATSEPTWRALVSIEQDGATQIDAAPSVGLPEIVKESGDAMMSEDDVMMEESGDAMMSEEETSTGPKLGAQQIAALALIAGAAVVLGVSLWRVQKKEGTEGQK